MPIKNIKGPKISEVRENLQNIFEKVDTDPTIYILDNEISKYLKEILNELYVSFKLVPLYKYLKYSKYSIQKFNYYFKSGLASTHPKFPQYIL